MKPCPNCDISLAEDTVKCPECGQWMVPTRSSRARPRKRGTRGWVLLLGLAACAAGWIWLGPDIPTLPLPSSGNAGPSTPTLEILRSDLETLFQLQEEHFRNRGVFAGLPSILGFTASDGVQLSIVSTGEAWSGTAVSSAGDGESGCAVFVGAIPAPRRPFEPTEPGRIECNAGGQAS